MASVRFMRLIYIEWADALTNAHWFEKEDAMQWAKDSDWIIREAGWLLEETREYIVIASGWKIDDGYSGEQFVNLHKIPKTWIRRRKVLTVDRK